MAVEGRTLRRRQSSADRVDDPQLVGNLTAHRADRRPDAGQAPALDQYARRRDRLVSREPPALPPLLGIRLRLEADAVSIDELLHLRPKNEQNTAGHETER